MSYDFQGKTVLVTGGGSGIGEFSSKDLAKEGANVVVADLSLEHAERVVQEIKSAGGEATAFKVDVSDPASAKAMVDFTIKTYGSLDGAVNNAGIGGPAKNTGDYEPDEWRKVMSVNLDGVFYCLKYELEVMEKAGKGSIVNMASILGTNGFATAPAYVAAKHGVVGLTKNAALEYSAKGIRVNSIGPGFIKTPLLEQMNKSQFDALTSLHPIGRLGEPEEVAQLATFLLSDKASFITGSYHLVDGAYAAQ
ncbi:MAG: SDR family oxidoreductase [Rhodobacteraceae bacterium]|nr:SDR family oxidoreductase [Paracoccaceae bacterium]